MQTYTLPPEWYPQSGVQLTWPHKDTDWAPMLAEVELCYLQLARAIVRFEPLLIVSPEPQRVARLLDTHKVDTARITFFECPTNDTWARDHAFLTLTDPTDAHRAKLLDFTFNGWGLKYAAHHDNRINARLYEGHKVAGTYCRLNFVLEGGAIESDGAGTLLTTTQCLMAPNRNQPMVQAEIDHYLKTTFQARQILWLDHGRLDGDDTDGHIDTLARFAPERTILYVQCTDPDDVHYPSLQAMEREIQTFKDADGRPYRAIPLPMAPAHYDEEGQRLPATYANFLIVNGAVLYPTYGQDDTDRQAAEVLAQAFGPREIIGIDCRPLIKQHGSLHCVTMQYPLHTLKLSDHE